MIYWMSKEELTNRKLPSLQVLIDKVGNNERLCDFGYCSSTAVSDIILLIAEHLTDKTLNTIQTSPFWLTLSRKSFSKFLLPGDVPEVTVSLRQAILCSSHRKQQTIL